MRTVLGALIVGLASCALVTVLVTSASAAGLSGPLPSEPLPKQLAVAATYAATPAAYVTPVVRLGSGVQFHEGAFVYIPPPTPQPAASNFHSGSYIFVASDAGSKGRLVLNATYGLIPVSSLAPTHPAAAPTGAVVARTPSPSPTATATPSPTPRAAAPAATALPTAGVTPALAASASAAPAVDDPRFYRGNFVYDPKLNKLLPMERSLCCAVPARADAASSQAASSAQMAVLGRGAASVLPAIGKAMYYNPGIMDQVLSYRLALAQVSPCPECVGYAALLRGGDLNRKVWIQWAEGDVEGPFLVIDVAASQHVSSLLARQWVIDVDYATAIRRAMNAPRYVTVLDSPPAPVRPKGFTLAANTLHIDP